MKIPPNKPFTTGAELDNLREAISSGHLSGDGAFTKKCHSLLEEYVGCPKALLTHSCTAALEMSAILANIEPGDEIIMPSYTFVSTANAYVLRGAVPVFVDIRPDTLNIDENLIEDAITERTKMIVPVHYAGVSCEMDTIMQIAARHGLMVVEDCAQGLGARYKTRPLGSIGHLATLSFHDTKNIICGEGGALLINTEEDGLRAEIVREKGTNRSQFFRGQVDKYTWVDIGSSYLPSELVAAFLFAQLQQIDRINAMRLALWNRYQAAFEELETSGRARRPIIPEGVSHNGHIYYLLLPDLEKRNRFIQLLRGRGIGSTFHYVPLHNSPMGSECSRAAGSLANTRELSDRLVRLPLWVGLDDRIDEVIDASFAAVEAF